MASPGRGLAAGLGAIVASAAAVLILYALGWFSPASHVAHGTPAPAADPVQLLGRITLAIGTVCVLASLAGELFRRIGQPPVAGEITAGLILGPSLLSTLVPGLRAALFPAAVMPYINVAAQAGLVVFMFTVGAEFDPASLRGQRSAIGAISAATMAVPFALGVALAVPLFGRFAGPAAATLPFAVFIGTALSVTAFPVLARIIRDAGLTGTRLGTLAQLSAAVTDVLVWFALAVALAMIHAQGPAGVLRVVALTALVAIACVAVLRPLIRALSERYAHAAVPQAVRFLVVAGIIVGLGVATDKIGVHAIFGGFLAGLVLPADNPLFGTTARRTGELNNALLAPVFFVSVGLQADARVAVAHPAVLAGGALLLVAAVAGKLGAVPLARASGMPLRSSLGLGVLMNARGVTEIVVLSIGLSAGVINVAAFTVLVFIAVLTTCMAMPALRLLGLTRHPEGHGKD